MVFPPLESLSILYYFFFLRVKDSNEICMSNSVTRNRILKNKKLINFKTWENKIIILIFIYYMIKHIKLQ